MSQQIFVNLAVADIDRSRRFFSALGYGFNETFSDEKALCMVVSEQIFVMLLKTEFFGTFTRKPVADAHQTTEVLICLSTESRDALEALVAKAVSQGARTPMPLVDHGFMVQHGFEDLDGHQWELVYMAESGQTAAS